jgi:CRISPR system Cascade subunit CasC
MTAPIYVDVHIIQTVPPANLNRDDAGSPKQAMYGGDLRARVSSQAWKRAARLDLVNQGYGHEALGVRTDMVPNLLKARLVERGLSEGRAEQLAIAARGAWGMKPGKRSSKSDVSEALKTPYLLFLGREQVDAMARAILESPELADETADVEKIMQGIDFSTIVGSGHPVDVALFGRMVADRASWNVEAATQVAHAISTHSIDVEFDYYTAVDDENTDEETGAGMIGTIEFNSATLYRYANICAQQLLDNLEGDISAMGAALDAFLRSFALSMPTGHQNSFAHRTAPQCVVVVVRKGQPVNLVTAFEKSVFKGASEGVAVSSIRSLGHELTQVAEKWGLVPTAVRATYMVDGGVEGLGDSLPFDEAIQGTVASVEALLTGQ